ADPGAGAARAGRAGAASRQPRRVWGWALFPGCTGRGGSPRRGGRRRGGGPPSAAAGGAGPAGGGKPVDLEEIAYLESRIDLHKWILEAPPPAMGASVPYEEALGASPTAGSGHERS